MKKNLIPYLLLAVCMIIARQLMAPLKYSWNPQDGSTQVGFNLQNTSDYLIQFQIYNESAGGYHHHILEIEPSGELNIPLNINVATKLKIYYCPNTIAGTCSDLLLPKANIIETNFPLGKTIYIRWDGKELLPQIAGTPYETTKAGYYLTNNVVASDYRLTELQTALIDYSQEFNRDPWNAFPNAKAYALTLRVAETYTDPTLSKIVLGLGGTPTDEQIDYAWQNLSAQWNPDDHPAAPNYARAVMRIINRSRNNLLDPIIRAGQQALPLKG